MRACFTLALCCYQLHHTLMAPMTQHCLNNVANFLDHNRNVTENQTPVFQSIWKRQILSAHFASHLVRGLEFQSANTNIYFSSLCGTLQETNGCVRCLFIKTFASDGFALDGPPNTLDVQLMSLDDAVMHTHYTVTSMDLAHFYQMHNLKQLRFRGLEALCRKFSYGRTEGWMELEF